MSDSEATRGSVTRSPSFYGWTIVRALALTTTVSYGVLYYSYAVFLPAMEHDLDLNRAQTSGAFSLALLVAGLVAPLVGRTVDRRGARIVMTFGAILATLLVLAWSRVTTLPDLYATWLLMGVAMACVFYDPAFAVVARWFRRDRPKALLIITLVAGLASTIFVPLTTALVTELGWRAALFALAGLLGVTTVLPHGLLLRRDPADLGLMPDGTGSVQAVSRQPSRTSLRDLTRNSNFRLLALAFSLAQFTAVALAAHLVPLLLERGYTPSFVGLAAGGVGLAALPGRALFAPFLTRWSLGFLATAVFTLRGTALLILLAVPGVIGVWAFVLLFGMANGMTTLVRASMVADHFGSENFGLVAGSLSFISSLAQAAAPFAVGALHGAASGYTSSLWLLLVVGAASVVAVMNAARSAKVTFAAT
ncbi:MFS transporter [Deinococcus yavapaiensis]|uniref:MFS transporter n=1 Tax=Deinococcus yavapaiensis TaxID=309889 RepID=UPI001472DBD4|nr:MFS transporter [Deinococcus yavapaiensis]